MYDQATFVQAAVFNVRDAIVVGGLFSVLILLAFLRSWRATLISALAIPTTLAITFLFLHWAGATLNLMSLGGLAVAIGLIIDDTVVVIENIARHLSASGGREPPVEAQTGGSRPPLADCNAHFFLAVLTRLRVLAFGEPGPTLFVGRTITSAPGKPGMPPRTRSRLFSGSIFTTARLRMVTRSLP